MSDQESRPGNAADQQDEETVQKLAEVHEEHQREIGIVQKLANRATAAIGRPGAVVAVLGIVICWIGANLWIARTGGSPLDPYPFPHLELFATICALLVTLLILTTQRHEQDVNRRRDQLTLHVALLTEKKIAKTIALLEEMRRDSPSLPSRDDGQAADMAQPLDPQQSLEKIEGSSLHD